MAVNKVVYGGNTLVDLTGDTVTANDLAEGITATGANGNPIVGIMQKVTIDAELSTTSTNPVQNRVIKEALDDKLGKNDTAVNASKVNNLTVETAVPKNAKFTDTVYTHPSTHPASMITGLASVATSGSYSDLSNKPTIPVVPTKVSAFINDAGYLTQHQSLDGYAKKTDISGFVKTVNGTAPDASGNVNVEEYTHPNSGVAAGTYRSVTVNAQGHVTAGSNPTLAIANGGTGATTASAALSNLGGVPTSEVANSANKIPRYNSSGHLVLPDGSEFWIA